MIKHLGMVGLLLFSCSKPSHWAAEQIHSEKAEYSFEKLSYHSPDPVNGIDLEFVRDLYSDRLNLSLSERAKQSQTEANFVRGPNEEHHCQIGKGDEEDQFGAVTAVRKGTNSTEPSINQIRVYLTVHSTQVVSLKDDPQSIAISIRSLQESFKCTAYRFQGGQRFLLSPENTEKMIELLKSKQEITILLNGYKEVLNPEDFAQKFETFLHSGSLRNPFQFSL